MSTFLAVTDEILSQRLKSATGRVILITPAISESVAAGLGHCLEKTPRVCITVVLDPTEDAYRIGYGDQKGLDRLKTLAEEKNQHLALRSQPGLRIGLLLVDGDVLVWSPTPQTVEGQRLPEEPNGLDLGRRETAAGDSAFSTSSLADIIDNKVGADDSEMPPDQTEIGRHPLTPEEIQKTVDELKENPPVQFDLAQKTRVLSTKFQFVEFEVRGALWTKREIKLSSLLLNADLPEELQDLFETRIRPFSRQEDMEIMVPTLVQGQVAYNREGQEILTPMKQGDIEKTWKIIRGQYLLQMTGFGWIIRRVDHERFVAHVRAFETVLGAWVKEFRERIQEEEETIINDIVDVINKRIAGSDPKERNKLPKPEEIKAIALGGIQNLRVTEPSVRLIFKEISWESTRDREFTEALRKVLTEEELEGWFEVFTAARQQTVPALDRAGQQTLPSSSHPRSTQP